jgi:hypothetical protein
MQATDEMFNGSTRELNMIISVYFDDTPLDITTSNYLIDCYVDELTWCTESSMLGELSPSSIDIKVANPNKIFTPSNVDGPYYGKIRIGLKIETSISINGSDPIPFGTYYVTEWRVDSADSLTASIYASDKMTEVLKADTGVLAPIRGISYKDFITYYFDKLGSAVSIDGNFSSQLLWGFSTGKVANDLKELSHATWSVIGFNRNNELTMKALKSSEAIRATLTDNDQIISISSKQSLTKTYDGASFEFFIPTLTLDELVSVDQFNVSVGITKSDVVEFAKRPVVYLTGIVCDTNGIIARVYSFKYTPDSISVEIESTESVDSTNISVLGGYINQIPYVNADDCANPLKYSNHFVQTGDDARYFKANLDRYVASELPVITVEIRGNALLNIGDKIEVNSTCYSTHFVGRIVSIRSKYDGSFSQTLLLLDDSIIG